MTVSTGDTPLIEGSVKPTNITILLVTTCAFGLFVIAEIIGALVRMSQVVELVMCPKFNFVDVLTG